MQLGRAFGGAEDQCTEHPPLGGPQMAGLADAVAELLEPLVKRRRHLYADAALVRIVEAIVDLEPRAHQRRPIKIIECICGRP